MDERGGYLRMLIRVDSRIEGCLSVVIKSKALQPYVTYHFYETEVKRGTALRLNISSRRFLDLHRQLPHDLSLLRRLTQPVTFQSYSHGLVSDLD